MRRLRTFCSIGIALFFLACAFFSELASAQALPSCTLTATPSIASPGESVLLQGTCANTSGSTTYSWSGPGTTICSSTSPICSITAPTTPGNYSYTLTPSSATAGPGMIGMANVTVVAPQPSCTLTAAPASVLPGATVLLDGTCVNLPEGTTFSWTGPGTSSCPTTTRDCTVTAPSTPGPVTYTLTANTGTQTTTPASATITVLAASCTLTATPTSPLPSGPVQLQGSCVNLPSGTTFIWSGPGTSSCSSTSLACTVTAPSTLGVATYTLVASAAGGSTAPATATINVGGNLVLVQVSGDNQGAIPGQPLANPLVVRLTDAQGAPVPGVTVAWASSNARDQLSASSVVTDAQGLASIRVTLADDTGNRTFTATALGRIVTFTARDLRTDLLQPALQLLTPLARVAVISARTQLDNVDAHLDDVRRVCNPGAAGGGAQASIDGRRLGNVPWDGFIAGEIRTAKQSSNGQQTGFKISTNGITLGGDFACTGNFVVGAALGFFKSDTRLEGGVGDQDAKGASVSVWGSFMPIMGAYIDVVANYGSNDYDSKRRTTASDLSASTKGDQAAVAAKGGYKFKAAGRMEFDPYFRVEHIEANVNGFGESGSAEAIAVSDLKTKSTVRTFGGKFRYTFDTAYGEITPHARLEVHRQTQDNSNIVTARLVSSPTVSQTTTLPQEDHSYGIFAIGASGIYEKRFDWYVNWEHLFGKQDFKSDSFTVRVKYRF